MKWLSARPVAILVVAASILAIAFPRHITGTLGLLVLAGAGAIALARWWPTAPTWLREPPEDFSSTLVISIVVAVGLSVFWEALTEAPDWQMGDWGPQHAVLKSLMPSLPGLHAPVWNHAVSTGDAPFELYPSFAYFVTGHLAVILGLRDDLPLALMIVAVVVHILLAVGTTVLAMRIAKKPVALVIGLLSLVDSGAVAHGGTVGLFSWGLLHSALSLAFILLAACGIVAAMRRPSLASSFAIWLGVGFGAVAHPAGLISSAAMIVGLGGVALFASDVPVRRPLVAIGHVGLGLALGAFVWMPLAQRILAYGEHYPNALHTPGGFVEQLMAAATPVTAFQLFAYAGFIGVVAGLWSRRASVVFISATAIVLFVGMTDAPYLAFDLAPGQGVARLGTERLAQIARPFLFASSGFTLVLIWDQIRRAWQGATQLRRTIAAAAIGVLTISILRAVPEFWRSASTRASLTTRNIAADATGRGALETWAKRQMPSLTPASWGRALFEEDTHEQLELTAETGLPTFHMGPIPEMLLRERIEDTSPESLRRFDVRWVIRIGDSPSLGDPKTELVLGNYHIRTIAEWDGKFARIEKGAGQVTTTKLDGDAVTIELTGTDQPALVALGTGFYPRWRATHAGDELDEPVYAMPTITDGHFRVVAAWVKPGRTTFTCDKPLPSDRAGLLISIGAAVFVLAAVVAWRRKRWKWRLLRDVVRTRRAIARRIPRAGLLIAIGAAGLFAWGVVAWLRPARDVGVGGGLRSLATVQARPIGEPAWQDCDYSRVAGEYRCAGLVTVYDGTTAILNDAAPSWPFNTPSISASIEEQAVEIRVFVNVELDGTYWAGSTSGSAEVGVEGQEPVHVEYSTQLTYAHETRTLAVEATVDKANWAFSMVRTDMLVPDRDFLVPPPALPVF